MKFRKIAQKLKIKIIYKKNKFPPSLLFWGNATGSTEVFLGLSSGSAVNILAKIASETVVWTCGDDVTVYNGTLNHHLRELRQSKLSLCDNINYIP